LDWMYACFFLFNSGKAYLSLSLLLFSPSHDK
jgi:hypothetical protein